jgi:GEVED domain/Calx-beta domain
LNLLGGNSNNYHVLELPTDLTLAAGANVLLDGSIRVVGPGVINNSTTLVLSGDTITATSGINNLATGILIAKAPSAGTANTIAGAVTTATGSIIRLVGTAAVGQSVILNVAGFVNNGTLELTNDGGSRSATLNITSGTLDNAGTIAALVGGGGGVRVINGNITNPGSITLAHSLTLGKPSGTHVNTGTIDVGAGSTLDITSNGTLTQTAGSTHINGVLQASTTVQIQGGVLDGTGTVAANVAHSGGSIAPGLSPGVLTESGDYDQSGGSIDIEIGGLTRGTLHDVFDVDGAVTLGGSLSVGLINSFRPAAGDEFLILDNDGTDAISGTFAGLPEAGRFVVDRAIFEITYVGSTAGADGNDVVLTVLPSDFGDAPDGYKTLEASGGAKHAISSGLFIGSATPDSDSDGFGNGTEDSVNTASDDDTEGATPDDEDAITDEIIVRASLTSYSVNVALSNTTGGDANLVGWIDLDGNGLFDADEAATATVADGATTATLNWINIGTSGPDFVVGESFARFRLTTDSIDATNSGGPVTDGEVEDYVALVCDDACWDGGPAGTGTDWNVAANWVGDAIPGPTNDVFIGTGFTGITSSQTNTIRSLNSKSAVTINVGTFTITDNSTIDAALVVGGTGTLVLDSMTLSGTGTLTNQATVTSNQSAINTNVANESLLRIPGPNSQINGTLTTKAASTIRIGATGGGGGHLAVANGFTNLGTVQLTELGFAGFDAILEVTSGTLVNAGTIETLGTAGPRTIQANVDNTGTISVGLRPLAINGGTLDTSAGAIDVAAGLTLTVNGGETIIGSATTLTGTGTIALTETHTLTLESDVTLAIGGPAFTFPGTVTVGPAGNTLTNQTTLSLTADTIDANLVNEGLLRVPGPNSRINGTLTTTAASRIQIGATGGGGGHLKVANGFTNLGTVQLTELGFAGFDAILEVTSGTLVNAGTIETLGTAGPRTIQADVDNTGTISVGLRPLAINGATLDSSAGAIDVAAGRTLTVNGGETIIGSATTLTGTGTIALTETHTLTLESDVTLATGGPAFTFPGTVTVGPAGKTLTSQTTLSLTGDTIDANLANEGLLTVPGPNSRINGTLTTTAASTIQIGGNGGGPGHLKVANGFTNNGTVQLTELGFAGFDARVEVTSGTLVNSGTIETQGTAGPRTVDAVVDNQGTITVGVRPLTFNKASAAHTNSGTVNILPTLTLDITNGGSWTQTAGSTVVNGTLQSTQTLQIQGGVLGGTGNVAANIAHSAGAVSPGQSTGILKITGDLQQSTSSGSLNVEIGPTITDFDQLQVTGDVTLSSQLNVISVGGFFPAVGSSFEVLQKQNTGTISGTFDGLPEGAILVSGGSLFQISYLGGTGNNDVVLKVVAADFGDSPNTAQSGFASDYPVTIAENGARHGSFGPTLGTNRDIENDGTHSANADFDDNDVSPDDEDGVAFTSTSFVVSNTAATTGEVQVDLQNADATANRLDAWVDFNQDGDWDDTGEQIFTNVDLGTTNGIQTLNFVVPQDAGSNVLTGITFARFRLSTTGGLLPTGAAADGEVEDLPITLLPEVTLAGTVQSVDEDAGTATVRVNLSTAPDAAVTVPYSVSGTATQGAADDYTITASPLVIAAGSAFGDITITVNDDNTVEIGETVEVTLGTPINAIGTASNLHTATIDDNDAATFSIADISVAEDGTATFTVTLDNPIDTAVTVDVDFTDGTATGGNVDYDSTAASVSFAANSTTAQDFTVTLNDENLVELTEAFTASLSTATTLGTRDVTVTDSATGTITDNDAATFTIADISVAENGTATFTVTLDNPIDTAVTVDINFTDGTATGGNVDYDSTATSVSFAANSTTAQDFTVTLNDENLVELTEAFTAALSTTTILGTRDVTVSDSAAGTITDNDVATFTIDDVTAAETGALVFTVSLDNPVDTGISIDITFSDVTATGGNVDYDSTAQNLTFSAGSTTAQSVSVTLNDDVEVEANETFTATVSTATAVGTRSVTASDSGIGTITDNDIATDFGDAPVGFPVTLSEDGARHVATGPTLGGTRDFELDGVHSANADADGADDDGIVVTGPLVIGNTTNLQITVSGDGFINAWADLQGNGDFNDAGEQFLVNTAVTAGTNVVPFSVPADTVPGTVVFRYRFTSTSVATPSPIGILPDGEVEDYIAEIILGTPDITSPQDATEDQTPNIQWSSVSGAVSYNVWFSRLTPTPEVLHQANVTDTSWTPPQTLNIGHYRVWVQAVHGGGELSEWSAPVTFQINTRAVFHTPERFVASTRPTIAWDSLTGAVTYDLWIDDVTTGTSQFVRVTSLGSTSYTPSSDWDLGRYRFWVRGVDADARPARWSRFEEIVVAEPPSVIGPVGGTFDTTPTFSWNPVSGAATYEVLLRDRLLGTQIIEDGVVSTNWTPTTELVGGPWTWHVLAVAQDDTRSFWSDPTDIYISGRTEVTSPSGTTSDTAPTFTWRAVQGAARYDLWVDKVGGPTQIVREQNLTTTSFTPATPLPAGDYRVWVQAISVSGGESPWSLIVEFTITAANDSSDSFDADSLLASRAFSRLPRLGRESQGEGAVTAGERAVAPSAEAVARELAVTPGEVAVEHTHRTRIPDESRTALPSDIDATFAWWAERPLQAT